MSLIKDVGNVSFRSSGSVVHSYFTIQEIDDSVCKYVSTHMRKVSRCVTYDNWYLPYLSCTEGCEPGCSIIIRINLPGCISISTYIRNFCFSKTLIKQMKKHNFIESLWDEL